MAEFVAAQASVLIVPTLGKGPTGFHEQLAAQLKKARHSVDVQVKAKTAGFLAEVEAVKAAAEATEINLKVNDIGITKQITEIRHKYEDLRTQFKKGLLLNLKIVGMSQLTQLGPMLASLNTSIVQLSQSSLLLPGILSGVASSFSAALVGSRGLTDAFKAHTAATKDSVSAAKSQRDANRMVKDSTRDLNRAVKDAKRNIEDLNSQLRDAPLDEAEAMLNLQEAQAEAMDRMGKSAFDQQKDLLRLHKAEGDLADTRTRNVRLAEDVADANAKGVSGADNVTAATDRLTAAMENAAKGSEAMTALNVAMGKLSTNAQDFVNRVRSLGGAWQGLQTAVQDRLFANLGEDIQGLAGKGLPMLQEGLAGIAGEINGNLRTAISTLGTGENQGFLERIFGNTADAQGLLDKAITPLLNGLLRLSAVGSDSLPRLASAFGDVMTRFENFIAKADGDGSLDVWIDKGMKAMTDLGNSFINLGKAMVSISDAFTGGGGKGFLELLEGGTKRLAEFLDSTKGQDQLKKFFHEARQEFAEWKPLLRDIPGIFSNISQTGQAWANILLPFLRTAGSLLKDHPGLVTAIFTAFVAWKTVAPIISGVKFAMEQFGKMSVKVSDAIGEKPTGTTGKVKALAKAFGPGLLLGAASTLATYMVGQFISGIDESTGALERQRAKASELAGALDDVTGAATTASQALVISQLQNATNSVTGEDYGNLIPNLSGVDNQKLTTAIASGDRGQVDAILNSVVKGATPEAVEQTEFWDRFGSSLRDAGLSSDDVAKAVNGDQTQVKRVTDWGNDQANGVFETFGFGPTFSGDTLRGLEGAGFVQVPDLLDLKKQLPAEMQAGANTLGTIQEQLAGTQLSQSNIAQANQTQFGDKSFTPAGSEMFGPGAKVAGSDQGVTITMPGGIDPQLRADIEANGGRVRVPGEAPDSPLEGTIVELRRDRAGRYVNGYATGGAIAGAGTGTSDSILARVSNGEFITRASSVAKFGREFFEALNRGELPKFDKGGPVGGDSWWPKPKPKPVHAAAGQTPGNFDRKEFSYYGQAQRARRGLPVPGPKPGPVDTRGPLQRLSDAANVHRLPDTGTTLRTREGGKGFWGSIADAVGFRSLPDSGVTLRTREGVGYAGGGGSYDVTTGKTLGVGLGAASAPAYNNVRPNYTGPLRRRITEGGKRPTSAAPARPAFLDAGTNPGLFDPATGAVTGLPGFAGRWGQPGRDGDSGDTSRVEPNTPVPGPSPHRPSLGPNPHLTSPGTTPGPSNGDLVSPVTPPSYVPFQSGAPGGAVPGLYSPENMAAGLTGGVPGGVPGLPGLNGLIPGLGGGPASGGLPHLQSDALTDFFGGMVGDIGQQLLAIGLQFLTGITGIDFSQILGPMQSLGGHFGNLANGGKKGNNLPANAGAQQILDGYPGAPSDFVGNSIYGANPAMQRASEMASFMRGKPYVWGGNGLDGTDCSGMVMYVVDAYMGKSFSGRTGGTGGMASSIPAKGGIIVADPSQAPPGTLRVGWRDDGAGNGHTAGTLPDGRNFESSTFGQPIKVGDGASGYNASQFTHWAYFPAPGYASGGLLAGPGSGTSDSILARVSNGEFITKAEQVRKNPGLFHALNSGAVDPASLPGFSVGGAAGGGLIPVPPPVPVPEPAMPNVPTTAATPGGVGGAAGAGIDIPEGPMPGGVEDALGALGGLAGGTGGVGGSAGGGGEMSAEGDPRAALGAAPVNDDHNNPALSAGVEGAFTHIGSLVATAASAAGGAAGMGAPGAGSAGAAAGAGIQAGFQMGGQVASGALNILSSLMVGTLTPSSGAPGGGAYGAPVLPQQQQSQARGPSVVNQYGDIHTASYDRFAQDQKRREQQREAPFLTPV